LFFEQSFFRFNTYRIPQGFNLIAGGKRFAPPPVVDSKESRPWKGRTIAGKFDPFRVRRSLVRLPWASRNARPRLL